MANVEAGVRPRIVNLFDTSRVVREPNHVVLSREIQAECRDLQTSAELLPTGKVNGLFEVVRNSGFVFKMPHELDRILPFAPVRELAVWDITLSLPTVKSDYNDVAITMKRREPVAPYRSEEKNFVFPLMPVEDAVWRYKHNGVSAPMSDSEYEELFSITRRLASKAYAETRSTSKGSATENNVRHKII